MGIETFGDREKKIDSNDGPDKVTFTPKGDKKGIELFSSTANKENKEKEEQERRQNLEQLDQQLQVEKLKDFTKLVENGDYQIETKVSGETHTLSMTDFYQGEKVIEDHSKMLSSLENQEITLEQLSASFSCKEIEGRPEPLLLDFKIDAIDLLSGSTDIAEKIRQTFAGTHEHYKNIYEQQREALSEDQLDLRKETTEEVKDSLHEQGYTLTEAVYENGPVIIAASLPSQNKQIVISSMDGAIWSLSGSGAQNSQLSPSEVIRSITSGEL